MDRRERPITRLNSSATRLFHNSGKRPLLSFRAPPFPLRRLEPRDFQHPTSRVRQSNSSVLSIPNPAIIQNDFKKLLELKRLRNDLDRQAIELLRFRLLRFKSKSGYDHESRSRINLVNLPDRLDSADWAHPQIHQCQLNRPVFLNTLLRYMDRLLATSRVQNVEIS